MYWISSFVLTMASFPAAIKLFESEDSDERVVNLAWKLLYILIPSTLITACIFFLTIEEKYRRTFYSIERGKDVIIKRFRESNEDKIKAWAVFESTKHWWKSIEEEVRGWVEANWSKWEEERPKWFDENVRARIPVEYIPYAG